MAVITVNPRTRVSRIPAARTYTDTADRYAATFANALDAAQKNEINTNYQEFKQGNISWDTFKKYLQGKIDSVDVGSSNRAEWETLMTAAEKFNIDNINASEKLKVDRLWTAALQKIPGEVTTKDRLDIIREIIKNTNPETNIYNDLVQQEANLKTQYAKELKASGTGKTANSLKLAFAELKASSDKINADYKAGNITGIEADQQLHQNSLLLKQLIDKAQSSGISVPDSAITNLANNNVVLNNRLAQREVGQVFDVFNQKTGEVEPVTHQQLLNDQSAGTGNYVKERYQVEQNNAGIYQVVDTTTGQVSRGGVTKAAAQANAAKLNQQTGGAFTVDVPDIRANGLISRDTYSYDPKSQSFTSPNSPNPVYAPSPNTGERFIAQAKTTLTQFLNKGSELLKNYFSPETGTVNVEKLAFPQGGTVLPSITRVEQPTGPSKVLTSGRQTSPFQIPELNAPVTQPKASLFTTLPTTPAPAQSRPSPISSAGPFVIPTNQPTPFENPVVNPFAKPSTTKENLFTSLPTYSQTTARTTGPNVSPVTVSNGSGLLDKIKSYAQSAFDVIKGIFK